MMPQNANDDNEEESATQRGRAGEQRLQQQQQQRQNQQLPIFDDMGGLDPLSFPEYDETRNARGSVWTEVQPGPSGMNNMGNFALHSSLPNLHTMGPPGGGFAQIPTSSVANAPFPMPVTSQDTRMRQNIGFFGANPAHRMSLPAQLPRLQPDISGLPVDTSSNLMNTNENLEKLVPNTRSYNQRLDEETKTMAAMKKATEEGNTEAWFDVNLPFPVKLHYILSRPEYKPYITWLPHGRAWRILNSKAFEEKVIPKFFRSEKYASFMRQVNGWSFIRITEGPDQNGYYHELFLRGYPNLCCKMKRSTNMKPSRGISASSSVTGVSTPTGVEGKSTPNFYQINEYAPLPPESPSGAESGMEDSSMRSLLPGLPSSSMPQSQQPHQQQQQSQSMGSGVGGSYGVGDIISSPQFGPSHLLWNESLTMADLSTASSFANDPLQQSSSSMSVGFPMSPAQQRFTLESTQVPTATASMPQFQTQQQQLLGGPSYGTIGDLEPKPLAEPLRPIGDGSRMFSTKPAGTKQQQQLSQSDSMYLANQNRLLARYAYEMEQKLKRIPVSTMTGYMLQGAAAQTPSKPSAASRKR